MPNRCHAARQTPAEPVFIPARSDCRATSFARATATRKATDHDFGTRVPGSPSPLHLFVIAIFPGHAYWWSRHTARTGSTFAEEQRLSAGSRQRASPSAAAAIIDSLVNIDKQMSPAATFPHDPDHPPRTRPRRRSVSAAGRLVPGRWPTARTQTPPRHGWWPAVFAEPA